MSTMNESGAFKRKSSKEVLTRGETLHYQEYFQIHDSQHTMDVVENTEDIQEIKL